MQSGTKFAAGIAVLTAVLIAVGLRQRFVEEGLRPNDGGGALTRDVASAALAPGPPPSAEPVEPAAARVALAADDERGETAAPAAAAAQGDAPLTRIVARVVDGTGKALAGATLLAVRADGAPRGSAPSPPTDDSGVATLALRDNELRAYKDEVYAMIFAVRARGSATAFSTVTPKRHAVTELGTVVLTLGGAVSGTAVDPEGAPIEGAVVLAVEPVVAADLEELRVAGPDLDIPRPRATSDERGRFVVDGIALHETRLWLHAPGRLWTIGRPVPVAAAGVTDVGPIVIEPAPPERRIAGQVRLPNGAPAGGAIVSHQSRQRFNDRQLTADGDGRFVIVPNGRGEHELVARDPKGTWSPSELVTVPVGPPDVTLVLRERRVIAITVTDAEGAPLAAAALAPLIDLSSHFFVGGGRFPPGENWTRTDAGGRADLSVPAQEFCVTASKSGYVGQRFGPYEPDAAPATLEIALEPEPVIAGVVRCDGVPVARVKIRIGQRLEGFFPREAGFPIRFFVNQDHGVRTDAEGRFICPVDDEWKDVTVLAESETHATGELQLTLEPGRGARDVEVEVTHGGAIEGHVLPPAGQSAEGLVVAGSRGDGLPVWTRTDERGRYRLDRLAPGPWRIEGRAEPPTAEVMSIARSPEEKDFAWSCDVTAGEVTRHDVDMRALGDVQLVGRFTLDDEPARGWTVALEAPQEVRLRTPLPAVELDGDGVFTLTAPAGRYDLHVSGRWPGTESVEVRYGVSLVGPRMDWSAGVRTGRLVESVERGTPRVRLVTGGVLAIVVPDAEGRIDARVPAGRGQLQHEVAGLYGLGWRRLREVEVEGP